MPVWYDELDKDHTDEGHQTILLNSKLVFCFPSVDFVKNKRACQDVLSAYFHKIPIVVVPQYGDYKVDLGEPSRFLLYQQQNS